MAAQWIERALADEIAQAVGRSDGSTDVFLVLSDGGDGKTVLLRQIGKMLGSENGIRAHGPWSGIIDLYHSDLNTNPGIEHALIDAYAETDEFASYYAQEAVIEALRGLGGTDAKLEAAQGELSTQFAAGMNQVAMRCRPVVAFDTAERLQYEADEVQQQHKLEIKGPSVRAWLAKQLPLWRNCVVLIMGRPQAAVALGPELARAVQGAENMVLRQFHLGGFHAEEADRYFRKWHTEFGADPDLTPEFYQRLWAVTEGNPVRLELAFEVVKLPNGLERLVDAMEDGRQEDLRRTIDTMLIRSIMDCNDPPLQDVLHDLAIARKGLTSELLSYLEGTDDVATAQQRLQRLAELSFVKWRERDDSYYLHDELYDLCDRALLSPPDVQRRCQRLVKWYEQQIAKQVALRTEAAAWVETVRQRVTEATAEEDESGLQLELQQARDSFRRADEALANHTVNSLLYRLRAHFEEGYDWYLRCDDEAIRSAQATLDTRLHNELLAFIQSLSPVDKVVLNAAPSTQARLRTDLAAAWVKRLVFRGQNRAAYDLAVRIKQTQEARLRPQAADYLGWFELNVFQAQAAAYAGNTKDAVTVLEECIQAAEAAGRSRSVYLDRSNWRYAMLHGRAYNNLGYVYWMPLGKLDAAVDALEKAQGFFNQADLQEELANTLDNMGRVYALTRHKTRAESLVDEALAIRKSQGREYRIALSYISKSVVSQEFGDPIPASQHAAEALTICEDLNSMRGIGLAAIAVGQAQRRIGNSSTQQQLRERDSAFDRSARELRRAVDIFELQQGPVFEPVRYVEALAELGATYRDWAHMLLQTTHPNELTARRYLGLAETYLELSARTAKDYGFLAQALDTYEDLAATYCLDKRYRDAELRLIECEELVPPPYKLKWSDSQDVDDEERHLFDPAQWRKQVPIKERVEGFWLVLGKMALLRTQLLAASKTEPAVEDSIAYLQQLLDCFVRASFYFECYGDEDLRLKNAFRKLIDAFVGCSPAQRKELYTYMVQVIAPGYGIKVKRLERFFRNRLLYTR